MADVRRAIPWGPLCLVALIALLPLGVHSRYYQTIAVIIGGDEKRVTMLGQRRTIYLLAGEHWRLGVFKQFAEDALHALARQLSHVHRFSHARQHWAV